MGPIADMMATIVQTAGTAHATTLLDGLYRQTMKDAVCAAIRKDQMALPRSPAWMRTLCVGHRREADA